MISEASLSRRLHAADIEVLVQRADDRKQWDELLHLLSHSDKRTSENAAWVMTHLPRTAHDYLTVHQNALIGEAMQTQSVTKRRLLLTLLEKQTFGNEPDTAFLNFCLAQIPLPDVPPGIRALCIKLSARMCRPYPELRNELRLTLEMLERGTLSAAVKCTMRKLNV